MIHCRCTLYSATVPVQVSKGLLPAARVQIDVLLSGGLTTKPSIVSLKRRERERDRERQRETETERQRQT